MKKLDVKHLAILAMFVALMVILGFTPIGLIRLGFCNATTLCIPVVTGAILLGWKDGLFLGAVFGTISLIGAFGTAPSALMAPIVSGSPVLAVLICYVPRLTVPLVARGVYVLTQKNRLIPYILAAVITLACVFAAVNSVDTIDSKLAELMPPKAAAVQELTEEEEAADGAREAADGVEEAVKAGKSALTIVIACAIPAVWLIVFGVILVLYRIKKNSTLCIPMGAAVGSLTNTVLYLGMIYVVYRLLGFDAESIMKMLLGFGLFVGMIEAILAAVIAPPVSAALEVVRRGRKKTA